MTKLLRISGAFLVAPHVAAFAAAFAKAIGGDNSVFHYFGVLLFCAHVFVLALGVPTFLVFRRLGWSQLWMYLIGGAAIGLISTYLIFSIPFAFQPSIEYIWSITLQFWEFSFGGAIGAAAFWSIAVKPPKTSYD